MRLAILLFVSLPLFAQPNAQLVTSDIENFWKAYDESEPGNRAPALQKLYLEPGSIGLREFVRVRIGGAQQLANAIEQFPNYFASIRKNTLSVETKREQIEFYLSQFQQIYPQAVFPPVYFLIGRVSTGGTITNAGLLIGTEIYSIGPDVDTSELEKKIPSFYRAMGTIERLPYIVIHELVHTQQRFSGTAGLIDQVMIEGAAEFITDVVTGRTTREQFLDWEEPNRTQLFAKFSEDYKANPRSYENWLYNYGRVTDQPADIGYWIGAEICRDYFLRAVDKGQALKDIIRMSDPFRIVRSSRYAWIVEEPVVVIPESSSKGANIPRIPIIQ